MVPSSLNPTAHPLPLPELWHLRVTAVAPEGGCRSAASHAGWMDAFVPSRQPGSGATGPVAMPARPLASSHHLLLSGYKRGWHGLALGIGENGGGEAGSVLCPVPGQHPGSYAARARQGGLGLSSRRGAPSLVLLQSQGGLTPTGTSSSSHTLSTVLSLQDPPLLSEHSQEQNKNEKQTSEASPFKGRGIWPFFLFF